MFLASILSLLPLAAAPTLQGADAKQPPPGMVRIPGGRTKVGSTVKDIERLLEQFPTLRASFGPLVGETPQTTVDVPDYYLMVTEVTNEQFAAYVRASGARPPRTWAQDVVDAAREAFLAEQARERAAAREAGRPSPPAAKFEEKDWWLQNWRDKPWQIPAGLECHPVVYVDYQDALQYARWAGLRLMLEEEYQRAVRGDRERSYPWGDQWEDGRFAATQEIKRINSTSPVGSFPEGVSEQGVFDLAGNAWEWTASPFVEYPGFKPQRITVGKGSERQVLDGLPKFSPDFRVVVGGSYQNSRALARGTIRRGTPRDEQTNAITFRCAASLQPGRDMALTIDRDIPIEVRPHNVGGQLKFDPKLTIALDRWQVGEGSCTVPGYAVIQTYDYILFTPVEEVHQTTLKDARDYSLADHPVPLGFFSTNQALVSPDLPPGTYLVAFRGLGATPEPKRPRAAEPAPAGGAAGARAQEAGQAEAAPPVLPLEKQIPLSIEVDNFILYDLTGKPVAAIPVRNADIGRPEPGSMLAVDREVKHPATRPGEKPVVEMQKWLEIGLVVPAKARKAFRGTLELRFAEGVLEKSWR